MFRTKKDIEGNEQLNKYIKYNTFYKAQDTNLSKSESKNTLLNLKNQIISKTNTKVVSPRTKTTHENWNKNDKIHRIKSNDQSIFKNKRVL